MPQTEPTPAASEPTVGVGPWNVEHPETPTPHEAHYDPELLNQGDRRNVADQYRYWRHDAIVAHLDTQRQAFHIAIENWEHDFNIGSVVRTANAFNVAAFHIVGKRRWNRRGAMVTDRYQHEHHHPDVEAFAAWARNEGLAVIGIDNVPGSTPIEAARLPERCILVFGQESTGLTPPMIDAADAIHDITQFGSTRSMNAGAAAAIAMHTWTLQHRHGWTHPN